MAHHHTESVKNVYVSHLAKASKNSNIVIHFERAASSWRKGYGGVSGRLSQHFRLKQVKSYICSHFL